MNAHAEHNAEQAAPRPAVKLTPQEHPTKVLLCWNNICILNRREVAILENIRLRLLSQNIKLEIKQFGLGYPQHLSDYLRNPANQKPDLLVSADLEVFEDSRIFERLRDELYPLAEWYALKDDALSTALQRGIQLLPYLAIPLVLYTWQPELYRNKSLAQIVRDKLPLHFGGINNSAGKSVVKWTWSRLGRTEAEALLARSTVREIPQQAFKHVTKTHDGAALVPTVYTGIADNESDFALVPTDGALAVPSYIAARTTVPEPVLRAVLDELLAPDILNFYISSGMLICPLADAPVHPWIESEIARIQLPDPDWLAKTSPEEFYDLYLSMVPGAGIDVSG